MQNNDEWISTVLIKLLGHLRVLRTRADIRRSKRTQWHRNPPAYIRMGAFIHTCPLRRVYEDALSAVEQARRTSTAAAATGVRGHIVRVLIYAAYRAFLLPRYKDLSVANYTFMPSPCSRPPSPSLFRLRSTALPTNAHGVPGTTRPVSFFWLVAAILSEWRMGEASRTPAIIYFEKASSIARAILKIRNTTPRLEIYCGDNGND